MSRSHDSYIGDGRRSHDQALRNITTNEYAPCICNLIAR